MLNLTNLDETPMHEPTRGVCDLRDLGDLGPRLGWRLASQFVRNGYYRRSVLRDSFGRVMTLRRHEGTGDLETGASRFYTLVTAQTHPGFEGLARFEAYCRAARLFRRD